MANGKQGKFPEKKSPNKCTLQRPKRLVPVRATPCSYYGRGLLFDGFFFPFLSFLFFSFFSASGQGSLPPPYHLWFIFSPQHLDVLAGWPALSRLHGPRPRLPSLLVAAVPHLPPLRPCVRCVSRFTLLCCPYPYCTGRLHI